MSNFYQRLISSLFIGPAFLYILYLGNLYLNIFLIIILILATYEIEKNIKQKKLKLFLFFLMVFFIYSTNKLRGSDFLSFIQITWIISIVWLSDIGGYVFGKIIGGKKLSLYSPNKTISGLFGSIIISQISIIIPLQYLPNFKINFYYFFLQFFICIISVFGDIFFSVVKRKNNIKDYSQIIPGHGGILDRIDGLIFAVTFYYFLTLTYVK